LGNGPATFFHHGWPLSADDWDAQMMFFLGMVIGLSLMIVAGTAVPRKR
jgi:hypothetical protein